ncbi:hypothetical protein D3C80_1880120 [compost metagenome]
MRDCKGFYSHTAKITVRTGLQNNPVMLGNVADSLFYCSPGLGICVDRQIIFTRYRPQPFDMVRMLVCD